jgi:hypothetical protein
MKTHPLLPAGLVIAAVLMTSQAVGAQAEAPSVPLVVSAGRPLRVALDRRVIVKRAGQPVTAILLDAVYAHDRVVVPKGTRVLGRVETLVSVTKKARARAILGGDLTPLRAVLLQFDTVDFGGGRTLAIRTSPVQAMGREPGKADRFKDYAIRTLPYHPTFVGKGTVYSAPLVEPLSFGEVTPAERAAPGTAPAPEAILKVRLLTALDSSTEQPGARVEAVLAEPVFAPDNRLIFPEGTRLVGEVTLAKPARSFRRNGQLRFLFGAIQAPDREQSPLKASLLVVASSNVTVDDEGGVTIANNKARFIAPGLAALALAGSLHGRLDYDTDGLGPEMQYGGAASGGVGGFLGLSAAGVGISMLGRTPSVALAAVGVARTIHATLIGKGRDVSFPPGTVIQLQLAPGPGGKTP